MRARQGRFCRAVAVLICTGLVPVLTGCGSVNGYVMNDSGRAYYDRGNYAMARHEFQRAVFDDPDNADYLANLASAMVKQGDIQGAERTYRQALHVNPMHQPSYHGLASLMVSQNRNAEAHDILDTWAKTQPYSAPAHIEMAWYYRQAGNQQMAAQSLQQALRAEPRNSTALAQMGQLHQDSGQLAQATAYYQRSLSNDFYQPEVQSRLSTIQGRTMTGRPLNPALRQVMGQSRQSRRFYSARPASQPLALAPQFPAPTYNSAPGVPSVNSTAGMAGNHFAMPYQVGSVMPPQPAGPLPDTPPFMTPVPDPQFQAPMVLAAPGFNADPAHTQMAEDLPVVEAY